jgi:hypothetical protein
MATNAIAYGDSISDTQASYGKGQWFDLVCQFFGWTRVGTGTGPTDRFRAAISGCPLQRITSHNPNVGSPKIWDYTNGVAVDLYAFDSAQFTARLAAYGASVVVAELGTNDYSYIDNYDDNPNGFAAAWDVLLPNIAALGGVTLKAMVSMTNLPAHGVGTWNGVPAWASSLADAWSRYDAIMRAKAVQYGFVYIDVTGCPGSYLPDGVHPLTAAGTQYYANAAIAAITPYLRGLTPDPPWKCTRKY